MFVITPFFLSAAGFVAPGKQQDQSNVQRLIVPECNKGTIVYVFGASCSGKSTLGRALKENLGSEWIYIDRDDLIDGGVCSESAADSFLEGKVRSIKHKVIIDAQIPWREKREGELYFLVLPPLEILLERDALRTIRLQRPEIRAYQARQYVIKTFQILDKMDKKIFDYCFDSSQTVVEDEVSMIKTFISN